jgi:hypothetical protein
MRNGKILACILSLLLIGSLFSCVTGEYMKSGNNDNMETLGVIQASFVITGSFRYRSVINNQAYMQLLAEAQKEYSGDIDVRDITWTIGGMLENNNYEYTAIGRVVKRK